MVADCAPGFQLHGLCNMPEVRGLFRNNEGLSVLSPAYPTFSLLSRPLPPDPLPGGKGGIYSFLMQGASPLASPRLSRKRHGLNLRDKCPEGAHPLCCLLTLPLACFLAPIPLPALAERSSRREGGDYKFILPGASPLASPGAERARHWLGEHWRYPALGLASWSSARSATATPGGVGQTKRGP